MLAHGVSQQVRHRDDSRERTDVRDAALLCNDQWCNGPRHAIGALDIHGHHQAELPGLHVGQRSQCRHAGIVDQAVQPPARRRDRFHRRVDLLLIGHVQSNGLHIPDPGQRVEILLLASTRVDEISIGREALGDLATDARAGARHQHRFHLCCGHGFTQDRGRNQQTQQSNGHTTHEGLSPAIELKPGRRARQTDDSRHRRRSSVRSRLIPILRTSDANLGSPCSASNPGSCARKTSSVDRSSIARSSQ